MSDIDSLRPNVREAVAEVDFYAVEFDHPIMIMDEWKLIRAELIRLQGERDALARRISEAPKMRFGYAMNHELRLPDETLFGQRVALKNRHYPKPLIQLHAERRFTCRIWAYSGGG